MRRHRLLCSLIAIAILCGILGGCKFTISSKPLSRGQVTLQDNGQEKNPDTPDTSIPVFAPEEDEPEKDIDYSIATVVSNTVNIRSGPGVGYNNLGELVTDDEISILEFSHDGTMIWGRFDKGWVSMTYLKMVEAKGAGEINGKVTENDIPIYTGPSASHSVTATLYRNNKVTIKKLQTMGQTLWGKMDYGWIDMKYVTINGSIPVSRGTNAAPTIESIITGTWISINETKVLSSADHYADFETWKFNANGTYSSSNASHTYADGNGWQISGTSRDEAGTFSYDGEVLMLIDEDINNPKWGASQNANITPFSVKFDNDLMYVYSQSGALVYTMYKAANVNEALGLIFKRNANHCNTSISGTWTGLNKTRFLSTNVVDSLQYTFNSDGTVSRKNCEYRYNSDTNRYEATSTETLSGVYMYKGSTLTVCLTSGGATRLYIYKNVTMSGSEMMLKDYTMMKTSDINVVIQTIAPTTPPEPEEPENTEPETTQPESTEPATTEEAIAEQQESTEEP